MVQSIRYMDINKYILIDECMEICSSIIGMFSYDDLMELEWDLYERVLKTVRESRKQNG